ncbi:P-loop NTPase family protein [Vibrio ulleungensis]|uniref:Adenylate kinase n=1 Tax=Vibrio ulleungensis TaxID=2807619 RepID=A0ABS2HD50_9VIBR|nr:adenylate kinase [Vibrio ulleungensis]MBM7035520.1 adenylate kinase [Vibrio ulleungensis]
MNRVAIFGKPGNGKSTLSKRLSAATGIPLHPLDSIVYASDGSLVARDVYDKTHTNILEAERWIIEGLGPMASFHQRLDVADTLVYIDLPYPLSYWWVTKRFLKGSFVKPEGWPDGSSVLKGTIQSYKTLRRCPAFWNSEFESKLQERSNAKDVVIIKSVAQMNQFIDSVLSGKVGV